MWLASAHSPAPVSAEAALRVVAQFWDHLGQGELASALAKAEEMARLLDGYVLAAERARIVAAREGTG